MFKTRLILMVLLAAVVMTPVQAALLDNMDNIAARPWTDDRDPAEGTGWLSQGPGVMKIDYGVTNDPFGVPDPTSGFDYLGNFVGIGGPGGSFDLLGQYRGRYDRVPSAPFSPLELGILTTSHIFSLDVFKTIANSSEHVRELQLYDSNGDRNTYSVQAEATADQVGAGWKTYHVPLSSVLENNADLSDIVNIKLWVSSWSAYVFQNFENPVWPDDYTIVRPTGTPVLIDTLRLNLVPEPATMTMLGFGGLALLRRRKKA